MTKVYITGIGCVCSAGAGKEKFLETLKNGISNPTEFPGLTGNLPPYFSKNCFMVKDFSLKDIKNLEKNLGIEVLNKIAEQEKNEKSYMFALYAALEAIIDACLAPSYLSGSTRVGISVGASLTGNTFLAEFIKKKLNTLLEVDGSLLWWGVPDIGTFLARCFEINGPSYVISTACASGTTSIAVGYDLIKSGVCDVVISGGTDCLTQLVMAGFCQLQSISKSIIRPFSKKRDGTMLGEGAAIIVLEKEEFAIRKKPYAEVTGYAMLNDGYHITAADPTGAGVKELLLQTIVNSGKNLNDVDYINTHGTGTIANDITEAKAIMELFREKKPYINATKALVGHLLAAAGAIETIATVLQIKHSFVAPTPNINEDDILTEGLNLATKKIDTEINFALNLSLGFGGNGCCIGLSRVV